MTKYHDELFDAYLDALQQDINAPVPLGLDPELAALAQHLSQSVIPIPTGSKTRVWETALEKTTITSNGYRHKATLKEIETMTTVSQPFPQQYQSSRSKQFNRLLALTAIIAMILSGVVLFALNENNSSTDAQVMPLGSSTNTSNFNTAQQPEAEPIPLNTSVTSFVSPEIPVQRFIISVPAETGLAILFDADTPLYVEQAGLGLETGATGTGGIEDPILYSVFNGNIAEDSEIILTVRIPETTTTGVEFTIRVNEMPYDNSMQSGSGGGTAPTIIPTALPPSNQANSGGGGGNASQSMPPTVPAPSYDIDAEPINIGDSVSGSLNDTTQAAVYELTVPRATAFNLVMNAEQPVRFSMRAQSLQTIGSSGGGGGGGGGNTTDNFERLIVYSYNAQVQIELALAEDTTPPVNFTLELVPTELITLETGVPSIGGFGIENMAQPFQFFGQRGELINLRVDGNPDNDLLLVLHSPNGNWVEDTNSGAGTLPEIRNYQLPENGLYYVEVRINSMRAPDGTLLQEGISAFDDFEVTLNRPSASFSESSPDVPLELEFNADNNIRVVQYETTMGESLTLNLERIAANPDETMTIIVLQNGQELGVIGLDQQSSTELTFPTISDSPVIISIQRNLPTEIAYNATVVRVTVTAN